MYPYETVRKGPKPFPESPSSKNHVQLEKVHRPSSTGAKQGAADNEDTGVAEGRVLVISGE
jgi:hypothetical protein